MKSGDFQSGLQGQESIAAAPAPLVPVAVGMMAGVVTDSVLAVPTWAAIALVGLGGGLLAWGKSQKVDKSKGQKGEHAGGPPEADRDGGCEIGISHQREKGLSHQGRPHRRWVGTLAVIVAAVGLGALRHAIADRWVADNHIVFCTGSEPVLVQIRGRVMTEPTVVEPPPDAPRAFPTGPKTRFVMEATEIAGEDAPIAVCGKVAVAVKDVLLSLQVGDCIQMTGWLYRPRGTQNPGGYDWARHQRRSGILAGFSCEHAESVIVTAKADGGGWRGLLGRVRARLNGYLLDDAFEETDPGAGIMGAMVMGARSAVPKAMNEAFVRTGNAHFLAASGMNVAWLAMVAWGIMRLIGAYYRTTTMLVALLIASYVLLAEPQPSIFRAGIVGVLLCLTIYRRGRYNALNALALSAVVVLLIDPMDVFRPAFQYSFLAVLALMHLFPPVTRTIGSWFMRMRLPGVARSFDSSIEDPLAALIDPEPVSPVVQVRRKLGFWAGQTLALSFSAWLITAPLSCYYFDKLTPLGWLQTMLLWFLAMPVTVVGYVTLLAGAVFPSSGVVMGPLLKFGTDLMIAEVQLLARIPGTMVDGRSPSIWWTAAAYATLGMWVYRRSWIPWRHGFKVAAVLLLAWWAIPARWVQAESGALNAWVLAVGDGNANVVELPGGSVLMYDCGTRSQYDAGVAAAALLRQRGISRIDTVVVSHPNFDHFSGIETLAGEFEIGRIVVNDQFERLAAADSSARRFLARMKERGVAIETVRAPCSLAEGGPVKAEVLWPPAEQEWKAFDANESSTVLRVEYAGRSILLTGDVSEVGMGALMSRRGGVTADVLILPHHGSVTMNTARFIAAVDPQFVVRSSGQNRQATTNGIERLVGERRYVSTADDGCATIRIEEGKLTACGMASGE